jgi:hypothetical protein
LFLSILDWCVIYFSAAPFQNLFLFLFKSNHFDFPYRF